LELGIDEIVPGGYGPRMITFAAIRIMPEGVSSQKGWSVESEDANGRKTIVSPIYPTQYEAEKEANRLTVENARGS